MQGNPRCNAHRHVRIKRPERPHIKARAGEIQNFTGIGSPYEEPTKADPVLDGTESVSALSARVLAVVKDN